MLPVSSEVVFFKAHSKGWVEKKEMLSIFLMGIADGMFVLGGNRATCYLCAEYVIKLIKSDLVL